MSFSLGQDLWRRTYKSYFTSSTYDRPAVSGVRERPKHHWLSTRKNYGIHWTNTNSQILNFLKKPAVLRCNRKNITKKMKIWSENQNFGRIAIWVKIKDFNQTFWSKIWNWPKTEILVKQSCSNIEILTKNSYFDKYLTIYHLIRNFYFNCGNILNITFVKSKCDALGWIDRKSWTG